MKTITLYSNKYFGSGWVFSQDARWFPLADDESTFVDPHNEKQNPNLLSAYKGQYADSVCFFFNALGYKVDYSDDKNHPNLMRIMDVGSTYNWVGAAKEAIDEFPDGPVILFSSQEPCTDIATIMKEFPNVYVMDATYGVGQYDRHLPFPSFFCRMVNPMLNIVVGYNNINLTNPDHKQYVYNNLKYRNDVDKSLTQYLLTRNNVLDQGAVTYRRDSGIFYAQKNSITDEIIDNHIHHFDAQITHSYSKHFDLSVYNRDDFREFFLRQNDMRIGNDGVFNRNKRYHPIWIYNKTWFSLINESASSSLTTSFFSEKTLYPLFTGHPFVINAKHLSRHYRHLEDLGFALFDEILDYPEECSLSAEANLHNIENIRRFNFGRYKKYIDITLEKSYNNKQNFTNTDSVLWKKLRKIMEQHVSKYLGVLNADTARKQL